jgi:hypothetical protein
MIKVGLIGNLGAIASQIEQFKKVRDIQLIGKSSIGMMDEPKGKYLSIPEYNRKDLIEAADFLIVDKSQLLLPDLMKHAVKNNKHLYITDYPNITPDYCAELIKLAEEARTMVRIGNIPGTEPLTNWIFQNWQEPAHISLFETMPALPDKVSYLSRNIFLAYSLFKSFPQKIRTSGIHHSGSDFFFINLRLDYATSSVFNLELLIQPNGGRHIRVTMPGKFVSADFATHRALLNQQEITLPVVHHHPLVILLSQFGTESFYGNSNLDLYYSTLQTLREVLRKIELFTPWN